MPAEAQAPSAIGIEIPSGTLKGDLMVPDSAQGLVIFAHGSGSSHLSPRNQFVARELNHRHLATFLFDLLTAQEERRDALTGDLRFNIPFLAERLSFATEWLVDNTDVSELRRGFFGASTGAAAALLAAARSDVSAVVSRGGRPDLARESLPMVEAPTLLIVGGNDPQVIDLNKGAFEQLRCIKHMEVVPGATHLFEEPGALEKVAQHAGAWFEEFLAPGE